MNEDNELENIKNPIIKVKRPVYHLITDEKLNDIISNSFIGSLCFLFFSILVGISISEKNIIYFAVSIIFLSFSIFFYWRKISMIRSSKKAPETKSFKIENRDTVEPRPEVNNQLIIIEANYGTFPDKTLPVTEKLKNLVLDNRLSFKIENDILDVGDPDFHVVKFLEVEYRIGNNTFKQKFKEHTKCVIP